MINIIQTNNKNCCGENSNGGGTGGGTSPSGHNHDDRYYTKQQIDTNYYDKEEVNELIGNADASLSEDVKFDVAVGGIEEGETIPKNTDFTDLVKQLASYTHKPVLINPTVLVTDIAPKEIGSNTITILGTFNQGSIMGNIVNDTWDPQAVQNPRSGLPTYWTVNGVSEASTSLTYTKIINKPTVLGNNSINVQVDYSIGPQPKDSKGANYLNRLPAGFITRAVTWRGFYYRTAIAGTLLPTAQDVRNATTRVNQAGDILLNTGTSSTRFDVFLPNGSSLISVIDQGNLNLNITSKFVLNENNFIGMDADNKSVLYRQYTMQVDNPYSISSTLKINVT